MTAVQASLVLALASLMSGIWQPLMGTWLDRGQILRVFWVILIGYSLGIATFLAQNLEASLLLGGSLMLVVAHISLRTVIALALVARYRGEERARASTLRYLVSNAALSVSALTAMLIFERWRWQLLVADLLTSLILAAGITRSLLKQSALEKRSIPIRESALLLKEAFLKNGRRIVGLNLITVAFSSHMTYLPLVFAQRGEDSIKANGAALFLNTVVIIVCLNLFQKYIRAWSDQRIGRVSSILIGLGMSVTPLVGNNGMLYAGIVCWTIGELIYLPWEQVQLFNCFPDDRAGLASGAVTFLMSIVHVLAPLLSTVLLSCPNYVASGLLFVLPFVGYALYRTSMHQSVEKEGIRLAS